MQTFVLIPTETLQGFGVSQHRFRVFRFFRGS